MKRHSGTLWMAVGLLCLLAAALLILYNGWTAQRAAQYDEDILQKMKGQISSTGTNPAYLVAPEMEMPTVTIDGREYIGILSIPSLQRNLPILSELDSAGLKLAPCRYDGSVYLDNFILAAHNYKKQFGVLKQLPIGEKVQFTDIDHNVFVYQISEQQILEANAVEELKNGDWDLTLFTCTPGGRQRIVVRCQRILSGSGEKMK